MLLLTRCCCCWTSMAGQDLRLWLLEELDAALGAKVYRGDTSVSTPVP